MSSFQLQQLPLRVESSLWLGQTVGLTDQVESDEVVMSNRNMQYAI